MDEAHLVIVQGHTFRRIICASASSAPLQIWPCCASPQRAMIRPAVPCSVLGCARHVSLVIPLVSKLCTTLKSKLILLEAFYTGFSKNILFGQAYQYLRHANTAGRKPVTIRLHFPGRSGQCTCCSWGRGRDVAEVVTAAQGHSRGEVLVFTSSRASCEDLRSKIAAADTEAVVEVYHAGLLCVSQICVDFVNGV